MEVIELDDHPFFVASQFHPEFKSRPERPAPLFRDFIAAALERAEERDHEQTARPGGHTVRTAGPAPVPTGSGAPGQAVAGASAAEGRPGERDTAV